MIEPALYLDSSAIAKVVFPELESDALLQFLAPWPVQLSSALARVEVLRAVRRLAEASSYVRRAEEVLQHTTLIHIDGAILAIAATLDPPLLRTLDAIHLATALTLGSSLAGFVTYDIRLAQAAATHGMRVFAPGAPARG